MEILPTDSAAQSRFFIQLGGGAVALSLLHNETGQTVTAIAVDHEAAITGSREVDLTLTTSGEVIGRNQPITVVNEGPTPRVTCRGTDFFGEFSHVRLDAGDMASAIDIDGERAALVCTAATYLYEGCDVTVIGEDDKSIIEHLMVKPEIGSEDIQTYLLFRQVTNYLYIRTHERPPFESYIESHVIKRYKEMLGDETFTLNLTHALASIQSSLTDAGITWQEEASVLNHFLEQSTIRPVIDLLKSDEVPLNQVQKVTLLYNFLRDKRFIHLMLDGWGQKDTPHKLTVLGLAHVDAIAEALNARGIITDEQYGEYADIAVSARPQESPPRESSVFQWSSIVVPGLISLDS